MSGWFCLSLKTAGAARCIGLLALLGSAATLPAAAGESGPLAQAEHAYEAGRYDQVAALTHDAVDPAALALKARALLTKAMLMDAASPQVGTLARSALDLADSARRTAPELVEPYLEGAIARGLLADRLPLQPAIRMVWEARTLIDAALRIAPNDPRALSTDGGWHLMLTGRLGLIPANLLFSASRSHGLAAFQKAFRVLGDDPNLLYHFAKVRLLQSDAEALPEARAALHRLRQAHPSDALGQAVQKLAPELRTAIAARQARLDEDFASSGSP